ncbi:tetrathionate reductase family octaheme c-type cytochrome [Gynuella sp.]|uniref:tetrathionate reductase family octaheme c-type cytochrome n=1 Tax=Gynuella sp. TaxID=2969146 RepID=UPI003D12D9C8
MPVLNKPLRWMMQWLFLLLVSPLLIAGGTADHQKFEVLQQKFDSLQQLNDACMSCHTEAPSQLHDTIHWRWQFEDASGHLQGKLRVMNGYHPSVASNMDSCDNCHIGYGLEEQELSGIRPEGAVDCMMCHDTTGEYFYSKFHQDGAKCLNCHDDGAEALKKEMENQESRFTATLTTMAQQVGMTTSSACGACHFHDGGADGAKHGDLDSSLLSASHELDVHLSADGANLTCSSCHQGDDHQLYGSRYQANSPADHKGVDALNGARATCVSCHGDRPMQDERLNNHTDRVACQTCHIPAYARGGVATKTFWDWSKAGERNRRRKPIVEYDEAGRVTYASQKGAMQYGETLRPDYRWFDGQITFAKPGDSVNPAAEVMMTTIGGGAEQKNSKIFPFHVFRSILPYDSGEQKLVPMHLAGRGRDAYWNGYNWKKSLQAGAEAAGMTFSGDVGFIETTMLWPLNHGVAPKEQALTCQQCHSGKSLLAGVPDLYIPGQSQSFLLDQLGRMLIILTIVAVVTHGTLRIIFAWRRKRNEADD